MREPKFELSSDSKAHSLCHYFYDKIVPTRRGIIVIVIIANIEHHMPETFLSALIKYSISSS